MSLMLIWRRVLWGALVPVSAFMGCRLYEPPTYQRVQFAPSVKTQKVLFIGNSLTYYNDLSGLLQQLSAKEPQPLEVDSVTLFNATLEDHWNITAARKHLDRGGWNYVVLQEYSTLPAENPNATMGDYKKWAAEVQRMGGADAKIIIFQNWTHEARKEDMEKMLATYERVQHEIGGEISPIGRAWERSLVEHPEIRMFEDEKHPTVAGTYLTACVLYKTIYHKPATGLPTQVTGMKLEPAVAAVMQKVADETKDAGDK